MLARTYSFRLPAQLAVLSLLEPHYPLTVLQYVPHQQTTAQQVLFFELVRRVPEHDYLQTLSCRDTSRDRHRGPKHAHCRSGLAQFLWRKFGENAFKARLLRQYVKAANGVRKSHARCIHVRNLPLKAVLGNAQACLRIVRAVADHVQVILI